MKDSVNSASRYYQGRFRDAERQAAIDLMLGEISNSNNPGFDFIFHIFSLFAPNLNHKSTWILF
jgi:hypothetical protein